MNKEELSAILKKNKSKISIILFSIGYTLICATFFMRRVTFLDSYLKIIKLVAVILLAVNTVISIKNYTKKDIAIMFFLFLLSTVVYYFSKDNAFIVLFLCIVSSKGIETNKIIKLDILVKIVITFILFVFSQFGLTNEHFIYRNSIRRFSFGYIHPNDFAFVLSSIMVEILYIINKDIGKRKWYLCFPIVAVIFIAYHYADSRAAVLLLVIVCILFVLKDKLNKLIYNKYTKFIIKNLWLILTIITLIMTFLYYTNTDIGIKLNKALSNRLKYNLEFLQNYKIRLFGNELELVSTEESDVQNITPHILDNSYTRMLLQYGIVMYIIFYYLSSKVFENAYNDKNTKLILVFLMFIAYGIVEAGIYKIVSNIFLIYFRDVLFEIKKDNKELDENCKKLNT